MAQAQESSVEKYEPGRGTFKIENWIVLNFWLLFDCLWKTFINIYNIWRHRCAAYGFNDAQCLQKGPFTIIYACIRPIIEKSSHLTVHKNETGGNERLALSQIEDRSKIFGRA